MIESPPDQPSVVVVVPTYNERPNLEALVRGVLDLGPRFRVVIVDDGSPDGTGVLADALATAHPGRVVVIHRVSSRPERSALTAKAKGTVKAVKPRYSVGGWMVIQ